MLNERLQAQTQVTGMEGGVGYGCPRLSRGRRTRWRGGGVVGEVGKGDAVAPLALGLAEAGVQDGGAPILQALL